MNTAGETPLTVMLQAAGRGDAQAAADVLPIVYDELRRLARSRLGRLPPGQTLQPTALVHEAYLRLIGGGDPGWNGRGHFFAAAARAMRNVLVDQARRKAAVQHGGAAQRRDEDPSDIPIAVPSENLLDLDELIKKLEEDDPRKGQVINLRFFAGLTIEETADVLKVSTETIKREWRYIKTWLLAHLSDGASLNL